MYKWIHTKEKVQWKCQVTRNFYGSDFNKVYIFVLENGDNYWIVWQEFWSQKLKAVPICHILILHTITFYSIHSVAMVFFPANNLNLEEENM